MEHNPFNFAIVILAGGIGSRLWPLSNAKLPKPFIAIDKYSGQSLLQITYERLCQVFSSEFILITIPVGFSSVAKVQIPDLPPDRFIETPFSEETLPIACAVTAVVFELFGNIPVVLVPSDSHISNATTYCRAIDDAAHAVSSLDRIVGLGVPATHHSDQYGVMCSGKRFGAEEVELYFCSKYIEKPSLDYARYLAAAGDCYWNIGIFAWTPVLFEKIVEQHIPELFAKIILFKAETSWSWREKLTLFWGVMSDLDIDHGIMEKIFGHDGELLLLKVHLMDWCDLGLLREIISSEILVCLDDQSQAEIKIEFDSIQCTMLHINRNFYPQIHEDSQTLLFAQSASGSIFLGDLLPHAREKEIKRILAHGQDFARSQFCTGWYSCCISSGSDCTTLKTAKSNCPKIVLESYEAMSQFVAEYLVVSLKKFLDQKKVVNISLSAGHTPISAYRILREKFKSHIDWSRIRLFQMDEYCVGQGCTPPFVSFLQQEVGSLGMRFEPLPRLMSSHALVQYEQALVNQGGLQLVLHGVGINGHIALNEPMSSHDSECRRLKLNHIPHHAFGGIEAEFGVTLGLKVLNAASQVILVASGKSKSAAIGQFLYGETSLEWPLTSLRCNPDTTLIVDAECWAYVHPNDK